MNKPQGFVYNLIIPAERGSLESVRKVNNKRLQRNRPDHPGRPAEVPTAATVTMGSMKATCRMWKDLQRVVDFTTIHTEILKPNYT